MEVRRKHRTISFALHRCLGGPPAQSLANRVCLHGRGSATQSKAVQLTTICAKDREWSVPCNMTTTVCLAMCDSRQTLSFGKAFGKLNLPRQARQARQLGVHRDLFRKVFGQLACLLCLLQRYAGSRVLRSVLRASPAQPDSLGSWRLLKQPEHHPCVKDCDPEHTRISAGFCKAFCKVGHPMYVPQRLQRFALGVVQLPAVSSILYVSAAWSHQDHSPHIVIVLAVDCSFPREPA